MQSEPSPGNSNYLPEDTTFIMGGMNRTDGSTVSVPKNSTFDIADISCSNTRKLIQG